MEESGEPGDCELSIVLPVFDGRDQVASAVSRLFDELRGRVPSLEIVLVDDGSRDGSADAIRLAAGTHANVVAEVFPENRGKGAAVTRGMLLAKGRVRAFTDIDIPYGAEPILRMYQAIRSGEFDAAVGDRRLPGSNYYQHITAIRRVTSHAFAVLATILAPCDTLDTQCGVKAFDGQVAAHMFPLLRERGFAFDAEALFLCRRYGLRVSRQPVSLVNTGPSTVSVARVALPMLRSIAKLRPRWRLGRYRDEWLTDRGRGRGDRGR
jgi:glycosyltransferase involved in cell wall biosynthesis